MASATDAWSADRRIDGFNVIASTGYPFGTPEAEQSLVRAKNAGATAIAIVPFLWQSSAVDPNVVRGSDMNDRELRLAIRGARALGLTVLVKPHVWVDGSWAGAVALADENDWRKWFSRYSEAVAHIAAIAAAEGADIFCVGTELTKTIARPEWIDVITAVKERFPRRIVYMAHNTDEAVLVPFWSRLDLVGVTLYPPLGADSDTAFRHTAMRVSADDLGALSARTGKPVLIGEIGIRSAQGAAARPWESAEEREAPPDPKLQADVLADWLAALDRPTIAGVLVWRWFTNPDAGGAADTDFTVQNKPAEKVLRCAWTKQCLP